MMARMDTATPTPEQLRQQLIRNFNTVPLETWQRPPLYENLAAQLGPGTAARKMGCSVDTVPPGKQSCPYHFHHAQEEMFIVLEGAGTLRVAGQRLAIQAGDVIFIPPGPEYPHQIINTSDAPLKYLSISTKEYPEVCEYPDSGKLMAYSWKDGQSTVRSMHDKNSAVDYWDGEP
jgi:uncharacterized cupin superfamily protein